MLAMLVKVWKINVISMVCESSICLHIICDLINKELRIFLEGIYMATLIWNKVKQHVVGST